MYELFSIVLYSFSNNTINKYNSFIQYSLKERPMSPCPPTTHSGLSMTSPLPTNVNLGSPVAPCAPFRTNNPVCDCTILYLIKFNYFK